MKRLLFRPELLCLPLLAAFAALMIWPLALLVWESIAAGAKAKSGLPCGVISTS